MNPATPNPTRQRRNDTRLTAARRIGDGLLPSIAVLLVVARPLAAQKQNPDEARRAQELFQVLRAHEIQIDFQLQVDAVRLPGVVGPAATNRVISDEQLEAYVFSQFGGVDGVRQRLE